MIGTLAMMLVHATQGTPPYKDPNAALEVRVQDLFERMTADEKMDILTGTAFTTRPIPRLGVPAMAMADAGQGVRGGMSSTEGPATAFPSGVAMASTWDPDLVGRIGAAIGEEALNKGTGVQVLLGPAVNIHRSPLGGRNGEYFSEDPFLAARLGVGYIRGMQATGCAATVKHFAANNQERDRTTVNAIVGERALREIYLPAFEAAVKEGGVWAVMSSYNRLNGPWTSADRYLLTDILKKGWGYDGMVMSDWGGVHETVGAVNAGNDLEMPGPGFLRKENVARALAKGQISQAQIDDNVHRILRTILRVGLLDGPRTPDPKVVDSPAHRALALEAATKGIVLLKNKGSLLPLDAQKTRSVAVIGIGAKGLQVGALGSPEVKPFYTVQPFDGIAKRLGPSATVRYAKASAGGGDVPVTGVRAEFFANRNLEGPPKTTLDGAKIAYGGGSPAPGLGDTQFSVRYTAKLLATKTGSTLFTLTADDGCRLFIDGKPVIDQWHDGGATPYSGSIDLVAGRTYDVRVEYYQAGGAGALGFSWITPGTDRYGEAVAAAKASDVAVVCVGTMGQEGEGGDRPSMPLPNDQDGLIEAVLAANPRTIVVLNNGTSVDMSRWIGRTPAVLETWFPGQEGGAALAAVLFGDANPSGKLPDTLAARREDYPDFGNFPGTKNTVKYEEGIYVGYRHFDKRGIAPLFPFGHGLSYTSFRYGAAKVSEPGVDGTRTVSLDVTNTGKRAGAEVVQMYVHDPKPKIDRSVRELKGFQKVMLSPGETKRVSLALAPRALAYCNVTRAGGFQAATAQWKADAGEYEVEIGASSRDIRQRVGFRLGADFTEAIPYSKEQTTPAEANDLARNRPVRVSSTEDRRDIGDIGPAMAVDGDDGTRWSSAREDGWIAVDLGAPTKIGRVTLKWEAAYATAYAVQTSLDGGTWSEAYKTDEGMGGVETVELKPVSARWVRVLATKRATEFGISLFGFEVYAPKS